MMASNATTTNRCSRPTWMIIMLRVMPMPVVAVRTTVVAVPTLMLRIVTARAMVTAIIVVVVVIMISAVVSTAAAAVVVLVIRVAAVLTSIVMLRSPGLGPRTKLWFSIFNFVWRKNNSLCVMWLQTIITRKLKMILILKIMLKRFQLNISNPDPPR